MSNFLSEAKVAEMNERAAQIVAMTAHFLDGQEPGVIGSVLMELMACYLVAHKIPKDPAREADIRAKLLAAWCETVWAKVASYEGKGERLQ